MPKKQVITEAVLDKLANKRWRMKYLYSIKGRDGQVIPYRRNKAQYHYAMNRWYFNIILKSRRVGFSTEVDLCFLDDTLFNPIETLIIAHTREDAEKLFSNKIMTAWNNLPQEIRNLWRVDTERANELRFDWGNIPNKETGLTTRNYSAIQVSNSGRSGGFSRVHISEFGKICALYPQKAQEIISGTIPAIPLEGQLDIESTAEGDTGAFHDMFWEAWNNPRPYNEMRKNEFKAHFYNWQWDQEEIAKIGNPLPLDQMDHAQFFQEYQQQHNLSPIEITYYYFKWKSLNKDFRTLKQEYPTTPLEAFSSSGDKFFDPVHIEKLQQYLRKPIRQEGPWKIYEDPISNHSYAAGIDPSEGVGGDNAAISIIDFSNKPFPKVVATFKNNFTPPEMLAHETKTKGLLYNTAFLIPERNNHGHVVINTLKSIYPLDQIYTETRTDKVNNESTDKLGYNQNISTRAQMFSDLNTATNEEALIIPDDELLNEFKTFPRLKVNQVRTKDDGTLGHWDVLTATALAFQGRTFTDGYSSTPQTYILGEQKKDSWYNDDLNNNYGAIQPEADEFDPHDGI